MVCERAGPVGSGRPRDNHVGRAIGSSEGPGLVVHGARGKQPGTVVDRGEGW